jgi:hypothetical protein
MLVVSKMLVNEIAVGSDEKPDKNRNADHNNVPGLQSRQTAQE